MKSLFVSFLAILPAVNAMETVVFSQRRAPRLAMRPKIICDQGKTELGADDVRNATGHHRYYGQSAYP